MSLRAGIRKAENILAGRQKTISYLWADSPAEAERILQDTHADQRDVIVYCWEGDGYEQPAEPAA